MTYGLTERAFARAQEMTVMYFKQSDDNWKSIVAEGEADKFVDQKAASDKERSEWSSDKICELYSTVLTNLVDRVSLEILGFSWDEFVSREKELELQKGFSDIAYTLEMEVKVDDTLDPQVLEERYPASADTISNRNFGRTLFSLTKSVSTTPGVARINKLWSSFSKETSDMFLEIFSSDKELLPGCVSVFGKLEMKTSGKSGSGLEISSRSHVWKLGRHTNWTGRQISSSGRSV